MEVETLKNMKLIRSLSVTEHTKVGDNLMFETLEIRQRGVE
jgi:hypothetical protein